MKTKRLALIAVVILAFKLCSHSTAFAQDHPAGQTASSALRGEPSDPLGELCSPFAEFSRRCDVALAPNQTGGDSDLLGLREPESGVDTSFADELPQLRKSPLPSPSWLARPLALSKFGGGILADEPVHDRFAPGAGLLTGVRFGWDFARRWGAETRLGFARTSLDDPQRPKLSSHENFILWDAELLFYPLADARWRPFALVGVGVTDVHFIDRSGRLWREALVGLPVGAGIKYRVNDRFAFRLDVVDSLSFTRSANHEVTHIFGFTAGIETRFGGGRTRSSPRPFWKAW